MNNLYFYKIGEQNKSLLKNSGLFEYETIKKELQGIKTNKKILILVNGLLKEKEYNYLVNYMIDFDKIIYVMSDSIALESKESLEIINNCDIVLHQAFKYDFKKINVWQQYSYLPELFYKYCKMNCNFKDNKVFFGGNDKGREDKFLKYKIGSNNNIKCYCKTYSDGKDNRLEHDKYLEELSKYKYNLVICRKEYRANNWITSRLFEGLAVDNLPLIDIDFDKNNCLFGASENNVRIKDIDTLTSLINFFENNEEYYKNILNTFKENVEKKQNNFFNIISGEIE